MEFLHPSMETAYEPINKSDYSPKLNLVSVWKNKIQENYHTTYHIL